MPSELLSKEEALLRLRMRLTERCIASIPMHPEMLLPLLKLEEQILAASELGIQPEDTIFRSADLFYTDEEGALQKLVLCLNRCTVRFSEGTEQLLSALSQFLSHEVLRNSEYLWFSADGERVCSILSEPTLQMSGAVEMFCKCIAPPIQTEELSTASLTPARLLRLASALYPISDSDRLEAILVRMDALRKEIEEHEVRLRAMDCLKCDLLALAEAFHGELYSHLSFVEDSGTLCIPHIEHLKAIQKSTLAFRLQIIHRIGSELSIKGDQL